MPDTPFPCVKWLYRLTLVLQIVEMSVFFILRKKEDFICFPYACDIYFSISSSVFLKKNKKNKSLAPLSSSDCKIIFREKMWRAMSGITSSLFAPMIRRLRLNFSANKEKSCSIFKHTSNVWAIAIFSKKFFWSKLALSWHYFGVSYFSLLISFSIQSHLSIY